MDGTVPVSTVLATAASAFASAGRDPATQDTPVLQFAQQADGCALLTGLALGLSLVQILRLPALIILGFVGLGADAIFSSFGRRVYYRLLLFVPLQCS